MVDGGDEFVFHLFDVLVLGDVVDYCDEVVLVLVVDLWYFVEGVVVD